MSPELPPGRPGPRERLGNVLLRLSHVAGAGDDRLQARIPALLEELGESFLIRTHNRLTRHQPETLTSIRESRVRPTSQAGPRRTHHNPLPAPIPTTTARRPPLFGPDHTPTRSRLSRPLPHRSTRAARLTVPFLGSSSTTRTADGETRFDNATVLRAAPTECPASADLAHVRPLRPATTPGLAPEPWRPRGGGRDRRGGNARRAVKAGGQDPAIAAESPPTQRRGR